MPDSSRASRISPWLTCMSKRLNSSNFARANAFAPAVDRLRLVLRRLVESGPSRDISGKSITTYRLRYLPHHPLQGKRSDTRAYEFCPRRPVSVGTLKWYCSQVIVGEKEIARELDVKENTVHQWMVRRMLPEQDGWVSGNPAWYWDTIERWAWSTGRMPDLRLRILTLLSGSPSGGGFATPITHALIDRGVVGPGTRPAKVASVLTDLFEEGYVSIHLRNEWRITDHGRRFLADRMELGQPVIGGRGEPAAHVPHHRIPKSQ